MDQWLVHMNFPRKRYGPMALKVLWSFSLDRYWSIECSFLFKAKNSLKNLPKIYIHQSLGDFREKNTFSRLHWQSALQNMVAEWSTLSKIVWTRQPLRKCFAKTRLRRRELTNRETNLKAKYSPQNCWKCFATKNRPQCHSFLAFSPVGRCVGQHSEKRKEDRDVACCQLTGDEAIEVVRETQACLLFSHI